MSNPLLDPKDSLTIHISSLSILKIIAVLVFFGLIYLVWDILVLLFVSLIFAATLGPSISWFEKKKIPRAAGILFIYAVTIFILSLVIVLIIPPITQQIDQLSKMFPFYYEKIMGAFGSIQHSSSTGMELQSNMRMFSQTLSGYAGSLVSTISGLFGSVATFFIVLVLTFYFSVKKDGLKNFILEVTPAKYQKYATNLFVRIQDKLGLWLRGQLLLSFIIFLITWAGLLILGVKYSLVLAIIAGITEVIPFIGPIIGAVPAVVLTFFQSPAKSLFVIVLYFVIQQLENNIIVPKVMQKAVGLNPIVVIIVLLLGAKVAGVLGVLLSIPIAVSVMTVAGDWLEDVSDESNSVKA